MNNRYNQRCAMLVVSLLLGNMSASGNPSRPRTLNPLTLKMKIEGYFPAGTAEWKLTLDAKSKAHLTIENSPQNILRTFPVSAVQIAQLRKVLAQEHFFDLSAEYGSQVVDGSTRTLSVRQGNRSKSITLYSLSENGDKLSEVQRALRVWNVVRHWFHDAKAVDLQVYDQRILAIVEGSTRPSSK